MPRDKNSFSTDVEEKFRRHTNKDPEQRRGQYL
jgi:hypothetical protein